MPAASPNVSAEGVMRFTVLSNGTAVPEAVAFASVTVSRAANTIPFARLVVADGDMASQSFPISDDETFKPGRAVTIKAGYNDQETTIFEGIVVRQGLKITGQNYSRLVIECRDKAAAMTIGRKNANYVGQSDSDILRALFSNAGLSTDIAATSLKHKEIVQYYCTDWDFAVAR